jgi:hypothetical protein
MMVGADFSITRSRPGGRCPEHAGGAWWHADRVIVAIFVASGAAGLI